MATEVRTLDPEGAIAEHLEHGWTLPADWYGDASILERERQRVFGSAWQYAGPLAKVTEPGQYFACTAGHVPVVVVRDRDGALNGFVNVCRHRAHLVVDGEGRRETLQCPYHAWTYGLDGCLRNAPRSDREPEFMKDELSLLPIRVETWGPFVFANPDCDAASFTETFPELPALVERSGVDVGALEFRARRAWESPVNWKVAIENYLECYHCPTAHPSFSRTVDVNPDRYALQTFRRFSSQLAPVRASLAGTNSASVGEAFGDVRQAQFHYLWPSTGINVYPGPPNLAFMRWFPVGVRRTYGETDYFVAAGVPDERAHDLLEFSRTVGDEDLALVEAVQRGLDSRALTYGRLLTSSEHLIQHFHGLLYEAIV